MICVSNGEHKVSTEVQDWPLAGGESNIRLLVEMVLEVGSSWEITSSCYVVYFIEIAE
jgi:hypothetical protein